VDHVEPEEDRNVHPRPFDRLPLKAIGLAGGHRVEHAANRPIPDQFIGILDRLLRTGGRIGRNLVKLADLLLESHPPE
jgi:hypothetical protein